MELPDRTSSECGAKPDKKNALARDAAGGRPGSLGSAHRLVGLLQSSTVARASGRGAPDGRRSPTRAAHPRRVAGDERAGAVGSAGQSLLRQSDRELGQSGVLPARVQSNHNPD